MSHVIKILVVDDEPSIVAALRRLLGRKGFHVDVASGGQEALDLLETSSPDVILSDFKMPGMNGADFLAAAAHRLPDVRCILMSGYTQQLTTVDTLFVPKPWDEAELLRLCRLGRLR